MVKIMDCGIDFGVICDCPAGSIEQHFDIVRLGIFHDEVVAFLGFLSQQCSKGLGGLLFVPIDLQVLQVSLYLKVFGRFLL